MSNNFHFPPIPQFPLRHSLPVANIPDICPPLGYPTQSSSSTNTNYLQNFQIFTTLGGGAEKMPQESIDPTSRRKSRKSSDAPKPGPSVTTNEIAAMRKIIDGVEVAHEEHKQDVGAGLPPVESTSSTNDTVEYKHYHHHRHEEDPSRGWKRDEDITRKERKTGTELKDAETRIELISEDATHKHIHRQRHHHKEEDHPRRNSKRDSKEEDGKEGKQRRSTKGNGESSRRSGKFNDPLDQVTPSSKDKSKDKEKGAKRESKEEKRRGSDGRRGSERERDRNRGKDGDKDRDREQEKGRNREHATTSNRRASGEEERDNPQVSSHRDSKRQSEGADVGRHHRHRQSKQESKHNIESLEPVAQARKSSDPKPKDRKLKDAEKKAKGSHRKSSKPKEAAPSKKFNDEDKEEEKRFLINKYLSETKQSAAPTGRPSEVDSSIGPTPSAPTTKRYNQAVESAAVRFAPPPPSNKRKEDKGKRLSVDVNANEPTTPRIPSFVFDPPLPPKSSRRKKESQPQPQPKVPKVYQTYHVEVGSGSSSGHYPKISGDAETGTEKEGLVTVVSESSLAVTSVLQGSSKTKQSKGSIQEPPQFEEEGGQDEEDLEIEPSEKERGEGKPMLCMTDKGAIRLQLPGRIQHKTTIKLTHYPEGTTGEPTVVLNMPPSEQATSSPPPLLPPFLPHLSKGEGGVEPSASLDPYAQYAAAAAAYSQQQQQYQAASLMQSMYCGYDPSSFSPYCYPSPTPYQ